MLKHIYTYSYIAFSFLLSSCSLDDSPNFEFVPLHIVSADLPESFTLNDVYTIDVTYTLSDECTSFERFVVEDFDTTGRNVYVLGIQNLDENVCAEIAKEETTSFNFIVKYDEPYTFRFWTGKNESGQEQYIEVEVPVN